MVPGRWTGSAQLSVLKVSGDENLPGTIFKMSYSLASPISKGVAGAWTMST